MAAVMVRTCAAAVSWSAVSGTEPSWTWSACSAVAAAFSRSHAGELAMIGAVAVIAVMVIVSGRLSICWERRSSVSKTSVASKQEP